MAFVRVPEEEAEDVGVVFEGDVATVVGFPVAA